jgi:hypothetical protein
MLLLLLLLLLLIWVLMQLRCPLLSLLLLLDHFHCGNHVFH